MNVLAKWAIGLLGGILVYIAYFIEPSEAGQMTDRLSKLGEKLEGAQSVAIGWQTRFLRGISAMFLSALTNLFGKTIFCSRSIGCSAVACGGPLALIFLLYYPAEWWVKALYGILFLFFAAGATSRETNSYDVQVPSEAYGILLLIASPAIYRWWKWNGGWMLGGEGLAAYVREFVVGLALPLSIPFVVGVLLVMCLVGMNRGIARRASNSERSWIFLCLLPVNAFVAGLFLELGKLMEALYSHMLAHPEADYSRLALVLYYLGYFITLSLLPALGALSIAVLALGPFLHRIIWPLIRRPIQAAAFNKLMEQHKLLFSVGAYCLYKAWPGNPIVQFIHEVLAKGK